MEQASVQPCSPESVDTAAARWDRWLRRLENVMAANYPGGYYHTKVVGVCRQSPMEHMERERERNQEIYGHQEIIIEQFI